MRNNDVEYLIMYIVFEEYYLYDSRDDEVSILFGGMLLLLNDDRLESMAPAYYYDWIKSYDENKKYSFSMRIINYLTDYSHKIGNPKGIINLIVFIKNNNSLVEEKYISLKTKSIDDLYKMIQILANKFWGYGWWYFYD